MSLYLIRGESIKAIYDGFRASRGGSIMASNVYTPDQYPAGW